MTNQLSWQLQGCTTFWHILFFVCLGVCAAMKCLCIYRNSLYSCNCTLCQSPVSSDVRTDSNDHSAPLHILRQHLLVRTFSTDSHTACMASHNSQVSVTISLISRAIRQRVNYVAVNPSREANSLVAPAPNTIHALNCICRSIFLQVRQLIHVLSSNQL